MRIIRVLLNAVFITAVFVSGFAGGLCVNVFMVRGVPMIHGGGELMMMLAIPASIIAGYYHGRKSKKQRRWSRNEGIGHTD